FVGAKGIGLGRHPREVEPGGTILDRADAVLPVVPGDEIAARVAHDRRRELTHQREHVFAKASPVRLRVTGFVDAAIDAAAEMLDEGSEQPRVRRTDHGVAVQRDFHVSHCVHSSFETGIPDESCAAPAGGIGLPASSGDRTAFFNRIEYGCCGLSSTARALPLSTALPRCMISTRSLM